MYISQQLRQNNIAEYILYMWQIEDIIRAYGCQLTRIKKDYIERFDYTEEQKAEVLDWYGNLINMVNQEGLRESGHMQINKILVQDLNDLHLQIMKSSKFPFYHAQYYKVLPFIVELRSKGNKEISETETCLNALYGIMMLRLKNQEISEKTMQAINEITTWMGMLSDYYIKDKKEGLEF